MTIEEMIRSVEARESRREATDTAKTSDEQSAAFELCTMVNGPVADVNTIAVDHHLYDKLCDRWHKRASDPQPYVRVYFRAFEEDYRALGFAPRKRVSAAELSAMADTGCQSCLMGIQMAERMGLNADDLIPVTMTMRAANEGWSAILGYRQPGHNARDTTNRIHHQHIRSYRHVTGLGMISETFPTNGEVIASDDAAAPAPCPCHHAQHRRHSAKAYRSSRG